MAASSDICPDRGIARARSSAGRGARSRRMLAGGAFGTDGRAWRMTGGPGFGRPPLRGRGRGHDRTPSPPATGSCGRIDAHQRSGGSAPRPSQSVPTIVPCPQASRRHVVLDRRRLHCDHGWQDDEDQERRTQQREGRPERGRGDRSERAIEMEVCVHAQETPDSRFVFRDSDVNICSIIPCPPGPLSRSDRRGHHRVFRAPCPYQFFVPRRGVGPGRSHRAGGRLRPDRAGRHGSQRSVRRRAIHGRSRGGRSAWDRRDRDRSARPGGP